MGKIKRWLLEVGENIYKAVQNGFYPFFMLLLLLTIPSYGQNTERAQKQQKVIERRTQSTPQYNNNNNNQNQNRPQHQMGVYRPYYYNPYDMGYYPYWNTNRSWDNRTYIVRTDDNRIPSQPNPLRVSVGVLSEVTTHQPTLSPYLTIGGKSFLLLQYHFGGNQSSTYYNNIYVWEVEDWGDEFQGVERVRTEFVLALGTSVNKFSPFVGMGFGRNHKWDSYFDETYTLSQSGLYSINKRVEKSTSIKLGTLYQWKSFEGITQISLGKEFRFGLGVGIKL